MVNYTRHPFTEHPGLVSELRAGDGRVFAHTNRSIWKQSGASLYSIHPLRGGACRPSGVYSDLYPESVCLSSVVTYFSNPARDAIMRSVRSRMSDCEGFSGVRRTVYGGLCGALEDFDMSRACIDDLLNSYTWFSAYFPPTFPNEKAYTDWRRRDCPDDDNPLRGSFWESAHTLDGWRYVERGHPSASNLGTAFDRADFALLLGARSANSTKTPQWRVLVANPT